MGRWVYMMSAEEATAAQNQTPTIDKGYITPLVMFIAGILLAFISSFF